MPQRLTCCATGFWAGLSDLPLTRQSDRLLMRL